MAHSAPQQQVVNGWTAKDLHEIQAHQMDDLSAAYRIQIIVIALVGVTALLAIGGLAQRDSAPSAPEGTRAAPPISAKEPAESESSVVTSGSRATGAC